MYAYEHSVLLDESKCTGCTTCLKHCPTEAIRIKNGRALINPQRCIDCGECIRVCPHKAKKAVCGKLANMDRFKWKIALPAPMSGIVHSSFHGPFYFSLQCGFL